MPGLQSSIPPVSQETLWSLKGKDTYLALGSRSGVTYVPVSLPSYLQDRWVIYKLRESDCLLGQQVADLPLCSEL